MTMVGLSWSKAVGRVRFGDSEMRNKQAYCNHMFGEVLTKSSVID